MVPETKIEAAVIEEDTLRYEKVKKKGNLAGVIDKIIFSLIV